MALLAASVLGGPAAAAPENHATAAPSAPALDAHAPLPFCQTPGFLHAAKRPGENSCLMVFDNGTVSVCDIGGYTATGDIEVFCQIPVELELE